MSGLIGRKIGMTSLFDENGKNIPCTVIEAGPCVVTQVRTKGVDGYEALQLGFDDKNEKHSTKAALGHFKKAGTVAKKKVVEFQNFATEQKLGELKKDNSALRTPLDVPDDATKEKSIEDDLNKAMDELQKNNADKAKPKQKSAAKQMKSLSKKMTDSLESGEMEQLDEDVKMLRQILDNLLAFSLSPLAVSRMK